MAKPSKLEVIDAIRELAEQNDVSPPFAIALAAVESDFDPNARSRNSPTGLGLFQLDRSTRQALGVDEQRYLNDYRMQARLGVMRLADLLRRFKGSYTDALLAHHVGTARLQSGSLSRKDFEFVDRVLEEMTEPGGRASDGGS